MHGISHERNSLDKGADDPFCGIIVDVPITTWNKENLSLDEREMPPRSELPTQKKTLPEEYPFQSDTLQRNDQSQIRSLYPSKPSTPAISLPPWQTVHLASCIINPKVPVLSAPERRRRALNVEGSLPQESSNRQLQEPTSSSKSTASMQNVNMMESNSSQIYEK
jgi:hypothetical protein